jgi:hypothetical protein
MATAGRLPSLEIRRAFLREVSDNIAFGRASLDPTYGAAQGSNLVTRRGEL